MTDVPDLQEYLYFLRPARLGMVADGPTPDEAEIVSRHFAYLQDLTEQGVMVLVGRTQNNDADTFGIAIFRAASEAQARAIMENDPAVRHGVMTARLFPYRIALMAKPS
jgi:uncharacterized protein YciI